MINIEQLEQSQNFIDFMKKIKAKYDEADLAFHNSNTGNNELRELRGVCLGLQMALDLPGEIKNEQYEETPEGD